MRWPWAIQAGNCLQGDLRAYSAAFEAFTQGQNPYVQPQEEMLPPVWNPPLFFVALQLFGFQYFSPDHLPSWMLLQVTLLSLTILMLPCHRFGTEQRWDSGAIAAITLFPIFFADFRFGQFGIITLFLYQIAFRFIESRRLLTAGLVIGLTSFKPHLGYVLLVTAALHRPSRKLFVGYTLTTVLLSLLAELWNPGVHWNWLHQVAGTPSLLGANLVSLVRLALGIPDAVRAYYLVIGVSIAGSFAGYTLQRRLQSHIPTAELSSYLLAMSAFFSPFGYLCDFAVLTLSWNYLIIRGFYSFGTRRTIRLSACPALFFGLCGGFYPTGFVFSFAMTLGIVLLCFPRYLEQQSYRCEPPASEAPTSTH